MLSASFDKDATLEEVLAILSFSQVLYIGHRGHYELELLRVVEKGTIAEVECVSCQRTLIIQSNGEISGGIVDVVCGKKSPL